MASTGIDFANANHEVKVVEDGPLGGNVAVANDGVMRRMSVIPGITEITDGAIAGTEAEKRMGIIEGFRLYPKAAAWSMLLSTAIIMEGYDVVLLASFYAFPQFNQKYGTLLPDGTYQVPAAWQAGLSNGANVGEIIGLFANGIISERYGYRKTMIVSLFAVICFIFIPFFAQNVQTLEVAEILCGIPWGVFQTLTTAYAAEVMPVPLRCYLCTYVNLCWVLGQLIASGVLRAMLNNHTQWAYRIPFAIQWIWPLPIIIGVLFAPESPWWLVRRGRTEDAKKALLRLTSKNDPNFNADDTIDMMIHTNALEIEISSGTSYWDCFKGIDLRRTEIVVGVWMIQNLCGSSFMGYSTYFYEQAGLATENAFDMSMAQYALGAIGTFLSWFLMAKVGRRNIYLYGLILLDVLLLIIGFVGIAPSTNKAASWVIGSMLLIYTFTYDFTVGPVCYSLVAELSSTRLRTKTIVLSRNAYNVIGIINNIWTPYMLNPGAWGWGPKTGFFWFGLDFLCIVWTFFRLPEPKGRTYGELDILFTNRVSARKFASTDVTQFHGETVRLASVSEEVGEKGGYAEQKEFAS
ncbi:hypothetical protein MMC34_000913 [Xylographa carneopallida]|nr:hypothetical protein [Xylographa carneopallida]